MTAEERAEEIVGAYCMAPSDKEGFIIEIAHAILEEREACAKVAESVTSSSWEPKLIAQTIRERK